MGNPQNPVYFVNWQSDPALIRIVGRATMHNAHLLKAFFEQSMAAGRRCFAFDFAACQGVDSTFMGTLRELAGRLQRCEPAGSVVVCRLTGFNLENFERLGLIHLPNVHCRADGAGEGPPGNEADQPLEGPRATREVFEELVRKAHLELAEDPAVRGEFEDVIGLMKGGKVS